jgi:hypothetical protein
MQQEPESRGGRLMVWLVGVMGVLIVVGFAILVMEIGRRIFTPKQDGSEPALRTAPATPPRSFGQVDVAIPEGARIEGFASTADRVIAHVRTREGASLGYVIDPATGGLLGVIRFPPAAAGTK